MKLIRSVVVLFLLVIASHASADIETGDIPYDILGESASGETLTASAHKGKVVIVTFWATWCAPCMKEMQVLSAIQKRVDQQKLQVIAISYRESRSTYKKIVKALQEYPINLSFDKKGKVAKAFGVEAIPFMIILGKDGKVFAKHVGYSQEALPSLIAEINEALAQPGN